MKYTFCLIFICSFLTISVFAQTKDIDKMSEDEIYALSSNREAIEKLSNADAIRLQTRIVDLAKKAEQTFKDGRELYNKGDYNTALTKFNYAVKFGSDKDEPRYFAFLAFTDLRLGKPADAAAAVSVARQMEIANDEDTVFVYLAQCRVDAAEKKYSDAIAACSVANISAGTLDTVTKTTVLNDRAAVYEASGDHAKAIADYSRVIDLRPSARSYYDRAAIYYVTKDYARTVADLDESIKLAPNASSSYIVRGISYLLLHDYDKAFADGSKAIKLKPTDWRGFYIRARSYEERGKNELAIADWQKVLSLDPQNQSAKAALKKLNAASTDEAKKDETKKLLAGIIGKDQTLTAETFKGLKTATDPSATSPRYKDANEAFETGRTLAAKQDIDGALAAFEAALAMDPKLSGAANNIGAMYVKKNALEKALHAYLVALSIDPSFTMAQENLDAISLRIRDARRNATVSLSKQGLTDYYRARVSFYRRQITSGNDAVSAEIHRRSSRLDCSVLQRAYQNQYNFNSLLRDLKSDLDRGELTFSPAEASDIPAATSSNWKAATALFDAMHRYGCIVRAFDSMDY